MNFSVLHRLKRSIPYAWDLNIYRGCEHACHYCYAQYSHQYLGNDSFFSDIYTKDHLIERLEMELSSPEWKREIVNIGGVCDSYQPLEKDNKLMPRVLELMIKYRTPIIISTKSSLILRDFDLLQHLAEITYVNIAVTITTLRSDLAGIIEEKASLPVERLEVLKAFRSTNASIGWHLMPIIPFITDAYEDLEEIFKEACQVPVDYLLPGTLYLRGPTRKHFMDFFRKTFPEQSDQFFSTYPKGSALPGYKDELYKNVGMLRERYAVSSQYMLPIKKRLQKTAQGSYAQR